MNLSFKATAACIETSSGSLKPTPQAAYALRPSAQPLLLERKRLRLLRYLSQRRNEYVICFDGLTDQRVVRLANTKRLQQPLAYLLHALRSLEFNACCFVCVCDEVENLGFAHDCGDCGAIGFFCMRIASELVEFSDTFVCAFDGLFGCDGLEFLDTLADAVSKG